MWVFTTQGFYSAVAHRDIPDHLLIRARVKADLERLSTQLPDAHVKARIFKDDGADYQWRLLVTKQEWATALSRMTFELNYPNFKNEVRVRQGAKRASLYSSVWSTLLKLDKRKPWERWGYSDGRQAGVECAECRERNFSGETECFGCGVELDEELAPVRR